MPILLYCHRAAGRLYTKRIAPPRQNAKQERREIRNASRTFLATSKQQHFTFSSLQVRQWYPVLDGKGKFVLYSRERHRWCRNNMASRAVGEISYVLYLWEECMKKCMKWEARNGNSPLLCCEVYTDELWSIFPSIPC